MFHIKQILPEIISIAEHETKFKVNLVANLRFCGDFDGGDGGNLREAASAGRAAKTALMPVTPNRLCFARSSNMLASSEALVFIEVLFKPAAAHPLFDSSANI